MDLICFIPIANHQWAALNSGGVREVGEAEEKNKHDLQPSPLNSNPDIAGLYHLNGSIYWENSSGKIIVMTDLCADMFRTGMSGALHSASGQLKIKTTLITAY